MSTNWANASTRSALGDAQRHGNPARCLNVLVLDEELPYPLNSGKRIRSFNLLRRLAGQHRITYVAHRNADACEAEVAAAALRDVGITPVTVDRTVPSKSGPAFYTRLMLNLLSNLPYSVSTHTSQALRREVRRQLRSGPYDLVHCEWAPYAQTMRDIPGIPVVVAAHNIESQIWQRYWENERPGLKRAYIRHQWHKFQRFERWAFRRADQVVFVSDPDAELGTRFYNAQGAFVVDNGVDVDAFVPTFEGRDRYQLLMMGSLDWRPNIDGIELFLRHVYPSLRQVEPQLRLVIIGRHPRPDWAEWVRSQAGVELHANVPDVRPHLARSGCLVVPLRVGGGSRLKILEAAASGLPVVSTQVGAEGLAFQPDVHYASAPNIESIESAVLESVRYPDTARRRARSARQVVEQRYSWDPLAARLDQCWRACVQGGSPKERASIEPANAGSE